MLLNIITDVCRFYTNVFHVDRAREKEKHSQSRKKQTDRHRSHHIQFSEKENGIFKYTCIRNYIMKHLEKTFSF